MSRYTESRELVQAIGREILAEGRGVTNAEVAAKIHERTGRRVSPNLLSEELQRFWALIGTELAQRLHIPEVPPSVAQAAQAFWIHAVEAADERWTAQKNDATAALEKAQAKLTGLAKELDEAHDQYREAEVLLRTERAAYEQLSAEHLGLVERFQVIEQAFTAAQAQVGALENQLASAQQSISFQQLAHEREQEVLQSKVLLAQQELSAVNSAVEGLRAELAQKEAQADQAQRAQEELHQTLAAEKLRAERLAAQLQVLERQERATRRTRATTPRRRG